MSKFWNKKTNIDSDFSINQIFKTYKKYIDLYILRLENEIKYGNVFNIEEDKILFSNMVKDLYISKEAISLGISNIIKFNYNLTDKEERKLAKETEKTIFENWNYHNDNIKYLQKCEKEKAWNEAINLALLDSFLDLIDILVLINSKFAEKFADDDKDIEDKIENLNISDDIYEKIPDSHDRFIFKKIEEFSILESITKLKFLFRKTKYFSDEAFDSILQIHKTIKEMQEENIFYNNFFNNKDEKNSKNDKKNSVQNNFDLSIEKLKQLNEFMQRKIIGQHKVIEKIHDLLVSNFYDLEETNRPAGVFFFAGPTGVGKTETAKVLSEFLYNHENINRFDMSEYKQDTAISKLIGADNGLVGYEEGGILINKMKKNPNSIILFDEIEKAHSTVLDLFLQILDEGFVTSNQGKKISFSNNIIIFTSNIGASAIFDTMNYNQIDEIIKSEVNNYFVNEINRPEVLGRIGKENIITFNLIQKKEHMFSILDIHFNKFINAFKKQRITLSFNKEIVYTNILIDVDKTKGARDIRNEFEQFKKHFNKALFQNEIQILDLKSKTLIFSYDNIEVKILDIK